MAYFLYVPSQLLLILLLMLAVWWPVVTHPSPLAAHDMSCRALAQCRSVECPVVVAPLHKKACCGSWPSVGTSCTTRGACWLLVEHATRRRPP